MYNIKLLLPPLPLPLDLLPDVGDGQDEEGESSVENYLVPVVGKLHVNFIFCKLRHHEAWSSILPSHGLYRVSMGFSTNSLDNQTSNNVWYPKYDIVVSTKKEEFDVDRHYFTSIFRRCSRFQKEVISVSLSAFMYLYI